MVMGALNTLSKRGGLRFLSVTLVTAVALLVISGCVASKNAVTPVATEGRDMLVAALAPEGTNTTGSGTVHLRLTPEQQLCFVIHVSGIELPATAAHIHRGAAGVTGPIVVQLMPPNASGDSSGCTHAPRDLISAILQHPADYYVNVHNVRYPDGAVRGQLSACDPRAGC